ncbi:acetylcholine receptor subunit alpha-type acr-16-like [Mytilus edulis]|uniref:acetylcholine receptor subunit alpha-type acr-16-like n=1 Tax=Mytilus edulis TaxID=6550 RepID=UPI0039F0A6FA
MVRHYQARLAPDFLKSSTSYTVSFRRNLQEELFNETNYNKIFRPENTVTVEIKYKLQYVIAVDIKEQTVSTTGLFSVFWNDSRLVWDKSMYGGIEYIYVPEDLVWHPDLVVLNSIIELENKLGAGRTIRISNAGQLRWEPIAVLSTACAMVLAWFPFDRQRCFIKLASMDHPYYEVYLIFKSTAVDTRLHETQADWELVETLQDYSYIFDDDGVAYPVLKFGITVKRLPLHYILIVIVPTILTTVLTFIAFFLPLKSGTRLGYIVTVVLTLVVLLTLFVDKIPSAAKFPSILVAVFTVTLGMAFLLIIIMIFVMRILQFYIY